MIRDGPDRGGIGCGVFPPSLVGDDRALADRRLAWHHEHKPPFTASSSHCLGVNAWAPVFWTSREVKHLEISSMRHKCPVLPGETVIWELFLLAFISLRRRIQMEHVSVRGSERRLTIPCVSSVGASRINQMN